ncbi:hypothetical protein ES703_86030 [subsurface metagenome]
MPGAGVHITTAVIRMTGVDFTYHLPNDIPDVAARYAVVQHGLVLFAHRGPVNLVHMGVVEVVTHESPCVIEDLPPLIPRLNHHVHRLGYDQVLEFLVGLCINDTGLTLTANEKLLAVWCHLHEVYLFENRFLLAFFVIGIEGLERVLLTTAQINQMVLIIDCKV